jgi:peptide deformylase
MAVFPIRQFPDPVLRTPATDVTEFDADLERLVADMFDTMYDAPGVGLAAPQIGVLKRLFVADIGDGPFVMANPEIIETSGKWSFEEGCLSVAGRFWEFSRPSHARAIGFDPSGERVDYEGDELLGRVLQHEIDHLDGLIILDRIPRRMRRQALKEIREESPYLQGGI